MTTKPADILHSCSASPDCLYRFPWSTDEQWNLGKGNWDDANGPRHDTVDGGPQSYSYDFGDVRGDEGHPVRAARGGRVALVHSTQSENTYGKKVGDPVFAHGARGEGNIVVIRHLDGTASAYCHLQKDQVFVEKDEYVPRGRVIALRGNTGSSGNPHLHFDVHPYFTSWDEQNPVTGALVKANWVPTMKIRFEDKSHDCYRPNVGDSISSNNLVTSAKFSCLLGPRQGQHSCVAGLSFDEFVAIWVHVGDPPLNHDGSRPPKSDMVLFTTHQEDGKLKFNGVFGLGKGGQQFVAGLDFKAFTEFWVKVGSTPTGKSDMITFATYIEGGVRKFAGLFGPGKGGQQFVSPVNYDDLVKLWLEARNHGNHPIQVTPH